MTTAPHTAPKLRETPTGWLALTADGQYPRIGVTGATKDEAAERFEKSRQSWLALLDQADDDA